MSVNNVQFAVASHILTVLAYRNGGQATSGELADSVKANPTFVRKTISKLAKAGLLVATRGAAGACSLARPPDQISLLEIYRASAASAVFAIHAYPAQEGCAVSVNIKDGMSDVLKVAREAIEHTLASMCLSDLLEGVQAAEKNASPVRPPPLSRTT